MFMNEKELFAYRMNKAKEFFSMFVISVTSVMAIMSMILFL